MTARRLAWRQLRRNPGSSILSIIALALPSAIVLAVALGSPEEQELLPLAGAAAFGVLPLAFIAAMVGAALFLSFRRTERTLALLASVGAEPRTLSAVVSTSGLILGGAAALLAALVGGATGLLIRGGAPTARDAVMIVVIAAATALVGWLAALAPAAALRSPDVPGVLRNAPRDTRGRWANVRAGRAVTLAGAVTLLLGAVAGLVAGVLPEGLPGMILRAIATVVAQPAALLLIIGIVMMLPAVFRRFGMLARGIAPRLAARDAERGGVRSAAVATTVVASTFIVSAYLSLGTASTESSIANYQWELHRGQVGAGLIETDFSGVSTRAPIDDVTRVTDILRTDLGATDTRVLSGALGPYWGAPVDDYEGYSGRQQYSFPEGGLPSPRLSAEGICSLPRAETGLDDFDCSSSPYRFELAPDRPSIWVADAADLAVMAGGADVSGALTTGGAVVLDPRYLGVDGTVDLDWWGAEQFVPEDEPGEFMPAGTPLRSASLPAVFVDPGHPVIFDVIVNRETAEQLGLEAVPAFAIGTASPSSAAIDEAYVELSAINQLSWLTVERGPGEGFDPAWHWGAVGLAGGVTLLLALVSVGLSRLEGRRTDRTLAAIGASPGIRRRITGWYTLFVVGVSAVTGTLVGALTVVALWPGLSSLGTIDRTLVLPLPELAIIGLAVPLLVTLVALLLPVGRVGRPAAD